jgi:hypothetical protein
MRRMSDGGTEAARAPTRGMVGIVTDDVGTGKG